MSIWNKYKIKDMIQYGYNWVGMVPIDEFEAQVRYQAGQNIYVLYPDGTEAAVISEIDFLKLKDTVMYGYERNRTEKALICTAIDNIMKCDETDMTDVLQEKKEIWEEVLQIIGFTDEDIRISVYEADINM